VSAVATATLYREQVLAHARAPGHSTPLDHADARATGANALCGDHLEVQLALTDERISGYAFHAEACVLVRAAASMLGDRLLGLDRAGVHAMALRFERLLQGEAGDTDALGDLAVFVDLAAHPARRKCARLPLATVLAALAGRATATTEEA
jgi:nitrogen fixation NifU-like protein